MKQTKLTRRAFLATATTTATITLAQANDAKVVPGKISPNEKLNVAGIGAGGKGWADITSCEDAGANIVAMCDVDWDRATRTFKRYPDVEKFKDFRNMLEKRKDIDALTVTTPDHMHAPAAYMAMKMGKHVYVQKPMTHTVAEARLLTVTAREMKVATQMGNQGRSGNGARDLCEMIWTDAIGPVREAHIWTHRPVWGGQGRGKPLSPRVTPEHLDWDRWLGCAPWRPYHPGYAPHDWRAWLDFGGGSLGDMACHIMDPAYWALKLNDAASYSVEVIEQKDRNTETFPTMTTIKYSFPKRADMPPVDVYWYDGHWIENGKKVYNRPKRPAGVPNNQILGDDNANGSFFVGDKGVLTAGEYGGNARLMPDEKMAQYTKPDPWLTRIKGQNPYRNWIEAGMGGDAACSNFDISGPLTEMVQFGNLVVKSGKKLKWDNKKGVVTNVRNASEIVTKEYRAGWDLPV